MIKAGALYFAILISFLVALLTGFLMVNIWLHHQHTILLIQHQRLERNIHSALTVAKEFPGKTSNNQPFKIDLYNEGDDFVTLTKKQWGGYFFMKAEAEWQKIKTSAIEMCGIDHHYIDTTAIYMPNRENSYLNIGGTSVITGNCYLPKAGYSPGANIEGAGYLIDKPILGKVLISKSTLPAVDDELVSENEKYLNASNFPGDSILPVKFLLKTDSVSNSFYNKTVVLYGNQWIFLSKKYLDGNVKIVSKVGITIGSNMVAKDIIVYAPKVEVETGFTGAIQIFANDTIIIRDGCTFLFPSMVAIVAPKNKKPLIEIGKRCKLSGDILLQAPAGRPDAEPVCSFEENFEVNGRIWCNGVLLLKVKGAVNGGAYSNRFVFQNPSGSQSKDFLFNVSINYFALSKHYSGTNIFRVTDRYKSIKWLN